MSLVFVASAAAAGPNVAWTTKDMKTAIRAIGYPKPHPKKLACKGAGATATGQFASFKCKATYPHHRVVAQFEISPRSSAFRSRVLR